MPTRHKSSFDFTDYLKSKKTVDDRALNRVVLNEMSRCLRSRTNSLQIVEVAAGIGTMFERLVEWNLIPNAHYTMLDINEEYIHYAKTRIENWAKNQCFAVAKIDDSTFFLHKEEREFYVDFHVAEARQFFTNTTKKWDLVIAHAFLDLVDVTSLLPLMFKTLKTKGLFYFSINFDGETILLPQIDAKLDKKIIDDYHQVMDEHIIEGKFVAGSQSGRKLFQYICEAGGCILEAGSSDWVVFPKNGAYPHKEAHFLHCIINTVEQLLDQKIDYDIKPWLTKRHNQIDNNQLVYIAHQVDFLGTV